MAIIAACTGTLALTLVATTEANALLDGETAAAEHANREVKLFTAWQEKHEALAAEAPSWLWQLILAADQFIVKRSLLEEPDGRSVIAGYHWFGDWARDTMIALPGLTLATGRAEVAKRILLAFSRYVDSGMLPNNFPDAGGKPEYNTVDAALWYFEAIRQYFVATQDSATLQRLFPVLGEMIDAHVSGTRYNIHVDPADGLLFAGGPGVQLTWMDAKIGDWVVTPRTGKPVEINALWVNALETMAQFARLLGRPGEGYEMLAAKAMKNFQKFWNAERDCCFDVIDAPGIGNDAALRPNQIFGVSLPVSPLNEDQQKAVVDVVLRRVDDLHARRDSTRGSVPAIPRRRKSEERKEKRGDRRQGYRNNCQERPGCHHSSYKRLHRSLLQFWQRQTARYFHDASCSHGILLLAIKENGQNVSIAHRGGVGIRRTSRHDDGLLLGR
jgi:glycogen debranching enzyme